MALKSYKNQRPFIVALKLTIIVQSSEECTHIKTSNKERTRLEGIPHGISQSHKKEATSGFVKYSGAV